MSWLHESGNSIDRERHIIECLNIITTNITSKTIDITPANNTAGRWSQEKFENIANHILVESRKMFMKKRHELIPVIVSPAIALTFQSLNTKVFEQFNDLGNINSTVYGLGILYGTILVYVDTMATENHAFMFYSNHTSASNRTILDEFPDINKIGIDFECSKTVIIGMSSYFYFPTTSKKTTQPMSE